MVGVIVAAQNNIGPILNFSVRKLAAKSPGFVRIDDDPGPLIGCDQKSSMPVPLDLHSTLLDGKFSQDNETNRKVSPIRAYDSQFVIQNELLFFLNLR